MDELANYIIKTKILYDPENLVKNFKKRLKNYPNEIGENIIRRLQGVASMFRLLKGPILRKDFVFINFVINERLELLWSGWFALNKIPQEKAPKWAKQKLKRIKIKPRNAYKKLETISMLGNNKEDFEKKLKLLSELCLETLKLSRKYYPKIEFEENIYKRMWYDARIKELLDYYD